MAEKRLKFLSRIFIALVIVVIGILLLNYLFPEEQRIFQFEDNFITSFQGNFPSATLSMGEVIIAERYGEDTIRENTTFYPEDTVYFILSEVSGISIQPDGYSWYDINFKVIKEDGSAVFQQDYILGDAGKLTLKGPVVAPFGKLIVPTTATPGNYFLVVGLIDMYTNETIEANAKFSVLEGNSIMVPEPVLAQ